MIDSHQHFWQYSPEEYDWIDEDMAVIRHDFTPTDLRATAVQLGVTGSVAVQARQTIGESQWLLELAASNNFIRGVVGWVPLAEPTVADDLAALAANPIFKGVCVMWCRGNLIRSFWLGQNSTPGSGQLRNRSSSTIF